MNDGAEGIFVVKSALGLHARPAGRFVALAGSFDAEVRVARLGSRGAEAPPAGEEEWVSGKSVLSLLSLAAGPGTALCIRAQGPDARSAVEALGSLLEEPEEASA